MRVTEDPNVQTQTNVIANDAGVVATPAAPVVTPDSAVDAEEKMAKAFVFDPGIQLTISSMRSMPLAQHRLIWWPYWKR